MNFLRLLLLASIFFSCTEKPGPVAVNRPTLVLKDSLRSDTLNPFAPLDRSPMDISYFPVDYTVQKMSGDIKGLPAARVIYSRPQRQGRQIFGSLIRYNEAWRLGANEATEIEFFQPVTIQNKTVAKGRYVLYAIPQEKEWTIIFNTHLFSWGLKPDAAFDVHRFVIPVQASIEPVEYFSMVFQNSNGGADLVIAWDTVVARLLIQF